MKEIRLIGKVEKDKLDAEVSWMEKSLTETGLIEMTSDGDSLD